MNEKKFYCKAEFIPMALRMALKSFANDRSLFEKYAPAVFTDEFVTDAETKIVNFEQLMKAIDVRKQLKALNNLTIPAAMKDLQIMLNGIEGYLNLAEPSLDIKREDFGMDKVRTSMHSKEAAGIVSAGNSLLLHLKRNQAVLTAKGLKAETLAALTAKLTEVESLKGEQNELKNKSGRISNSNIGEGNQLWDILTTICDAGAAIFRGVDSVKMKEYTISAILKRIKNTQSSSDETPETTAK